MEDFESARLKDGGAEDERYFYKGGIAEQIRYADCFRADRRAKAAKERLDGLNKIKNLSDIQHETENTSSRDSAVSVGTPEKNAANSLHDARSLRGIELLKAAVSYPQIHYPQFRPEGDYWKKCRCAICMSSSLERKVDLFPHVVLRHVSTSLRDAVDKSHRNNLTMAAWQGVGMGEVESLLIEFPGNRYKRRVNAVSDKFFSGSKETRSVQIHIYEVKKDSTKFEEFKNVMLSFLDIIAPQIWRFDLLLGDIQVPFLPVYNFLVEVIRRMTNLKWMGIDLEGLRVLKDTTSFAYVLFPRLEHLQGLYIRPSSLEWIPDYEIFDAILSSNPNIKSFHYNSVYFFEEEISKFVRLLAEMRAQGVNLLTLDIDCCYRRIKLLRKSITLEMLKPLLRFDTPLKVLRLMSVNAEGVQSLGTIFHVINHFPSLETLCLAIDEIYVGGYIPFLKLSNLKEFKLMKVFEKENIDYTNTFNVNFFFSLQFLYFCSKLNVISWEYRSTKAKLKKIRRFMVNHECHESFLNFRAGQRDLSHSNIWEVFPDLQYVKTVLRWRKLDVPIAREWTETKEYRNAALVSSNKNFGTNR